TEEDGVIGRITTAGVITEFPVAGVGSFFAGIASGPDGALWFTEQALNKIGRITTAGSLTAFTIPTVGASPASITTGPDGALWFTEEGPGQIGRITTAGTITEFPTPSGGTTAGITAGPDGALWFTEPGDRIGRSTTAGVITEVPLTSGSVPEGIAPGPDGALWFAESGSNNVGRITTGGTVTEFPIPTSASTPLGITAGPANALWFTEYYGFKIGRLSLGLGYYTVTPCRVADTRGPTGPYGGPALVAGDVRSFVVDGQCGIPSDAIAVSLNLTVTQPTAPGDARVFPAGMTIPLVSTLNWSPGQTRACNAVVTVGPLGDIALFLGQGSGSADFLVDVNGYFK
ncbi:MAG TPA: hypothetical protein VKE50_00065, partial [Thermoanaerobaculia bacterium]|nr:hypothetical protein [Thermoanaerobaculia bacterium]